MSLKTHPAFVVEASQRAQYDRINEIIERGDSSVQRFYDGAVIFISGGSGFLGKQLIEKLFRSCKIHKLYVILRPRNNNTIKNRLHDVLQDPLYDYLHKNQPDFVNKIIPIEGDITNIHLDIDKDLWSVITKEINVIIHGAATVNFTETLKVATLTNVRGTWEMLKFAKTCTNLRAFVHISTAFAHATVEHNQEPVLEQFYKSPLCPELLIQLIKDLDEERINYLTPELIKGWPNTYSFTKAIAEEVVRTKAGDLPVCIVRPAIVLGALHEPPGWLDKSTINGPVGFILGACIGALHVAYGNVKTHLDLVPVDQVNNAVLVAAHETTRRRERGEHDTKIYTVTATRNSISIGDLRNFCENEARNFSTPKVIWYGYTIITKSRLLFALLTWLLHYVPGYLADGVLVIVGKKPRAMKLLKKAFKQNNVYAHFMMNEWKCEDFNLLEMYNNLSKTDRIIFNCDTGVTSHKNFLYMLAIGVRKYILKDGLKGTEYGVRKQFWLRILNVILIAVYGYALWKVFNLCFYLSCVLLNNVIRFLLKILSI